MGKSQGRQTRAQFGAVQNHHTDLPVLIKVGLGNLSGGPAARGCVGRERTARVKGLVLPAATRATDTERTADACRAAEASERSMTIQRDMSRNV